MRIECPHCARVGELAPSVIGKVVGCPKCGGRFRVGGKDERDSLPKERTTSSSARLIIGTARLAMGTLVAIVVFVLSSGFADFRRQTMSRQHVVSSGCGSLPADCRRCLQLEGAC
jgi:Zn finger protein HypA/HybF involved in hydrogenase expression